MNVTVNCVAYGFIKTRLTVSAAGESTANIDGREIKVGVNPDLMAAMERVHSARPRRHARRGRGRGVPVLHPRVRLRQRPDADVQRRPDGDLSHAAAAATAIAGWTRTSRPSASRCAATSPASCRRTSTAGAARASSRARSGGRSGSWASCCPRWTRRYGGAGATLAYQLVVQDELAKAEVPANTAVHTIVAHYILDYGTEAQKQRWLPKLASGEMLAGIALTEPGCGSDLKALRTRARREGDDYVIDGAKTFITNGFTANLLVVAVRTGDAGGRGVSLVVLETENLPGFTRRPAAGEAGPACLRHRRAVLRRRARAGGQPDRREGGRRLRPADEPAAVRAAAAVRAGGRGDRARGRADAGIHAAAQGLRPDAGRLPEHALQARRVRDASRTWCAASSTTASSACSTARSTTRPPTWPSGGAPSSSARSPTSACSCSAATATWPSTRSRGCTPTRASSASTAAPPRS